MDTSMDSVNSPKLVECQCLDLLSIVRILSHSISEEQAWALCYQTVNFIQRDHSLYLIEDMSHIIIDIDGNVHSLMLNLSDKSRKCTYSLRRFLSYFGGTLFEALDFGFPENVDRVLDPKLEHLIELLTETYDYNDENDSNDEGIEQDSPDDNEYRDKILQLCVSRLSPNENAECHYKQICKELVTETLELKTLLEKITTGQKELQKTSFIVNSNAKVNKINSNLGDVKLTDWATPWLQVIREFKRGVRLKPVCFNNVNSRIEHKLLPYEILLDDIRMKRYKLNKVMINGDVPQGVKKDVHDLTLEFIRSKPALVPASKRPLAPRPEEQQTLYEKLMHSIRQPHKLKSTPLSSAKHSPVYLGRVMQGGKNNPKVDTPISHRRVIKPNLTLRLSISSEDEEELNSEEWTNCSPESYGNNDSETKKSEESNVMLESDFEKDQKWFAGFTRNFINFFQRRS